MALSKVRPSSVALSPLLQGLTEISGSCRRIDARIFRASQTKALTIASRVAYLQIDCKQHWAGATQVRCSQEGHAFSRSSCKGLENKPSKPARRFDGVWRVRESCHQAGVRTFASSQAVAETFRSADSVDGSSEDVGGVRVTHRFVRNGSVRIHYVECGDPKGQLAVLLHGWPSFWYGWLYQIKALTDAGYHVVIPDMRGYNLSDKPSRVADYGREPVVSDVRQLIEKSGGGRPAVLIAHDWGGGVAWNFVRSHPPLVSRLVILNMPETSVFADAAKNNREQQKKSWYIGFFQIPFLPEWLLRFNGYKGLQAAYTGSKPRTPEFVRRHVDAFSRPGALTASINFYRAAGRGHWKSPGETPERIDLPVKVIWGEDDLALGKELATPPKELVPNLEVVFLPGVSHWCMWDEPDRVNAEILEFLARNN